MKCLPCISTILKKLNPITSNSLYMHTIHLIMHATSIFSTCILSTSSCMSHQFSLHAHYPSHHACYINCVAPRYSVGDQFRSWQPLHFKILGKFSRSYGHSPKLQHCLSTQSQGQFERVNQVLEDM